MYTNNIQPPHLMIENLSLIFIQNARSSVSKYPRSGAQRFNEHTYNSKCSTTKRAEDRKTASFPRIIQLTATKKFIVKCCILVDAGASFSVECKICE